MASPRKFACERGDPPAKDFVDSDGPGEFAKAMHRFTFTLICLLLTLKAPAPAAPTTSSVLGSGVVRVEPEEAGFDRKLKVQIRDLDGWLVQKIRAHRIVHEKYFTAQNFRVWLSMLPRANKVPDWGVWFNEMWREEVKAQKVLQEWKATLGSPATDPQYPNYEFSVGLAEERMAALRAYTGLRTEVRDNLYLILNNSRLRHVRPIYVSKRGEVREGRTYDDFDFVIRSHPEDEEEWSKLIRGAQRRVRVDIRLGVDLGSGEYTIARASDQAAEATDARFHFVTYGFGALAAGSAFVLLAFGLFLWLGAKSDVVRDPDLPRRPDGRKQFSLARCQTAFWFFLFIAGYVFLAVVKRETNTLTDQCLVLLGISTGTMLGANFITKSLHAPVASTTRRTYPNPVMRFFYELLGDGERLTFYRFQMLIWTLILGMVFVKSVFVYLQMPTFGTNELALMGICAGSYLAFKFPEAKTQAG
jgi:hypothetical protein